MTKAVITVTEEGARYEKEKKKADIAVDAVTAYFRAIQKFKLLTADEEKALVKKIKKGDMRAREALINANLRFAIHIARKYYHKISHLKMSDLIQAGNEGLIKAVDGFNPKLECRFSTYAIYLIKQAIMREISGFELTIRNPMHVVESLRQYNKAVRLLTNKLDRPPTISEIAAEIGESETKTQERKKIIKKYVSLDESLMDRGDTLGNFIEGNDGTEAYASVLYSEFKEKFAEIFESSPLDDKHKEVLRLRYGIGSDDSEGLTLDEIGARFGLTRERIRQVEAKALKRIKKYMKSYKEFL